ncbi:Hypothetical protein A7982_03269 [Minicystis rosea]|nr:Hypothetical protein A7982_03269 [Minicystis rosea]
MTLSIKGTTPKSEDYEKLAALETDEEKQAFIDQAIESALGSTDFYSKMVEFGHDWIKVAEYTTGAVADAYQGNMSGDLLKCESNTKHPDIYWPFNESGQGICNDLDPDGNAVTPVVEQVEPWWAPGTQVPVLTMNGNDVATIKDKNGNDVDCGHAYGGYYNPGLAIGCGCGPNLAWCFPYGGLDSGGNDLAHQRRHPWDEPARLFAHIAWYDRPLSDIILGNYSVGNNMLRALYLRMGRQNSANKALDKNTTWWKPDGKDLRDPLHTEPNDTDAWREFVVATLNPNMLSLTDGDARSGSLDRTYAYDPRKSDEGPKGMPTAGVLTSMGFLSSFARERPRAARALEMFACKEFTPPDANIKFPDYDGKDPAVSGTCVNCHTSIDPAAIFFKRWDFGQAYYVPWPFMPDVGPWKVTKEQLSMIYPYTELPYPRWVQSWIPGTVLTPITEAELEAHPGAIFLDTLPPETSLYGETSDGTMGPLGLAKILVKSGEFDRCAVQRLYQRFVGRSLDKGKEAFYIKKLASKFVEGDRKLRPFIKFLFATEEFGRGI